MFFNLFHRYFEKFSIEDYARSGNVATQEVVLEEGALPEFSHAIEPQLRQLGLPTALKKGNAVEFVITIHCTDRTSTCKQLCLVAVKYLIQNILMS